MGIIVEYLMKRKMSFLTSPKNVADILDTLHIEKK